MAKIGLNNFWYSHLTEAQDGTPSYDGAKTLGKAISSSASITNNSAKLYADDVLAESDSSFQSGTLTLGVDDDRDRTFADLLGHSITEEGEVLSNANDIAPWVACGKVIVKLVENVRYYKAVVFYKVKFHEPNDEDNTKGESVEFSTPSIEGDIATLKNGDWRTAQTFTTREDAVAYITNILAPSGTTYSVVYDANGGSGSISTQVVNAGQSVTIDSGASLTPPTDKEFKGWATISTSTTPVYEGGESITPSGDITLYAVWGDAENT